ncbi:MAG TPA: ribosomal-processing cysteine protease Prp [Spirochaetia bacterium]|nr:ribosomal-processing cysteine protease Prp [Spirochaetia bacterium]
MQQSKLPIIVTVEIDSEHSLKSFASTGHAGQGIVCAAATVLLRTAARLLAGIPEFGVRGSAPEAGKLQCSIDPEASLSDENRIWLRGITDFLVRGLSDISREYPEEVNVTVKET